MAIDGMAGKIGRVTLWPFAFSATRARTHYRQQLETLRWAGISDEDAGGATDVSPIAVPMRFGPVAANVAVTLDPRTRSVDPEGATMTVTAATTNTGTANIVSGAIVTTAAASFTGESRTTFTLSDGSAKRSTSIAYGTITPAVDGPGTPELPTPLSTVDAANRAALVTAITNAVPGRHIRLTGTSATAYAGGDITISQSGTEAAPIVIRGTVTGTACGIQANLPLIPFNIIMTGHHVILYGINFKRPDTDFSTGITVEMGDVSHHLTVRRCFIFRKCGDTIRPRGADHTVDYNDMSLWGFQEIPTTDRLPPQAPRGGTGPDRKVGLNWLPRVGGSDDNPEGPKFHCCEDMGADCTDVMVFRNYIHDCPFKMAWGSPPTKVYDYYAITGFGIGHNPTDALDVSRWIVKENLIWKGGHMDISVKRSQNKLIGNTIDGAGNKVEMNQRSGNDNEWLSNWVETNDYSPNCVAHGGRNIFIGNRLPNVASGKICAAYGDHPWDYTYRSTDPTGRQHHSYRALFWGNQCTILDGFDSSANNTVAPKETQFVPSAGQTYLAGTGANAPDSPNRTASPPTGRSIVPAVKLVHTATTKDVGPSAVWIAPASR